MAKKAAAANHEDALASAPTFQREFVVLKAAWSGEAYQNEANIEGTREYALQNGLVPVSHGKFVGAEDHVDGLSVTLTYEVEVKPSHIDGPRTSVIEDDEKSSGALLDAITE